MRNTFFALPILLASCQNSNLSENKTTVVDSSATLQATPDAVKRVMDSIQKANPGAKISFEGTASTKIEETETKDLNAADLQILNPEILDSKLKSSSKKYTLVHFWATWCAPCRKEFPELVADVAELPNANVLLVSSDYDSDVMKKKVLAVYQKLDTRLPCFINEIIDKDDYIGTQSQKNLIKHYGLNSDGGLPFNILIENKSKKVIKSSGNYQDLLKFIH